MYKSLKKNVSKKLMTKLPHTKKIRNDEISSSLSKSTSATRPQRKMGRSILPCSFTANAGWIKMIQLTRSMDRAHPAGVEWENKEQTMCTVFCGKKVRQWVRQKEPEGYLELWTFNLSHVLHPRKFINWTVSGKFRYPSLYFRRRKQRCRCSKWDILTNVVPFFFFFF